MTDALLGVVLENLNSLIHQQVGLILGFSKEMNKLKNTLSTIRNVLEDAEEKQLKDKIIRHWLKKLKDVAYDADDILDECAIEDQQSKATSTNQSCTKQVSSSFLSCFSFERIIFRHKMGQRISEIREILDEIDAERLKFNLREGIVDRGIGIEERETSSILTEPKVYGRDKDRENIVQQLLNNVSNLEELSIYPIIGMGGLGKTTLAQLAYNDETVVKHFKSRIWVCVSESFDVKRLLKDTIKSAGGKTDDLVDSALDPVQHRLRNTLSGKRFLLVLDDAWNEDENKWDTLKYSLTCGAKGSSIVVTTRSEKVATMMGTLPAYQLSHLSEEDCLSLFKQRAFGTGRVEDPNLVEIGQEIVKKCGGVPLAAKALGSLMAFKSEESEWLSVRKSEIWDLPQEEIKILPALRLSYNHLPPQSRQCFAYCSVFPKDYLMEKEVLIHLWITNGFIQSEGIMELEDVGNKIFNDLLWRSFFQDIKKDEDGNIESCKMHDLVHDLACSLMEETCSIVGVGKAKDILIRHLPLILDSDALSTPHEPLLKSQPIRTLLFEPYSLIINRDLHSFFSNLRYLRVLDLRNSDIKNLPIPIGKLKHLRYLDLSHTKIATLPTSFSSLRYLQILKLRGCHQLGELPKDMKNLSNLRHLDIKWCHQLTHMPIGMGQLKNLRKLSNFMVGQKSGHHISELRELKHLRGEVEISRLEHVKNSAEAKEADLMRKQGLRSLGLYWTWEFDCENSEEVLEALQPHQSTRRLEIGGYRGVTFPRWMGVLSLPTLVEIRLINWKRCEHLPPLGQLPHLKVVNISGWDELKYIGKEFWGEGAVKGFPSLEELSFEDMKDLEEWSIEEAGDVLHRLSRLSVVGCPKLKSLPLLPSLERLEVRRGNEGILSSLKNLTSLSDLVISGFKELICFPEGVLRTLTALQSLSLYELYKLKTLPMELENLAALSSLNTRECKELVSWSEGLRNLTSLKSLTISGCDALKSLAEHGFQGLSSLRKLHIWRCDSLTSLSEGLGYLTSLEKLTIEQCPELESLPSEDLKHLISLRHLCIYWCPKLTSLGEEGIQHLTSLRRLSIWECEKLTSLPEGLQHLTALQTLSIMGCPHLERRCERERGEDWHKIAHIQQVDFE